MDSIVELELLALVGIDWSGMTNVLSLEQEDIDVDLLGWVVNIFGMIEARVCFV